jgi:hypothetical protein
MRIAFLALCLEISLVACSGGKKDFSPLGPVTSVTVSISARDSSKYLTKISDPKDLSRLVAFVDVRRTNWGTPWYGVPVPIIEAEFFDGERLTSTFGAGDHFFETQREGGFFSKSASSSEIRTFVELLGVDEATVKELTK